MRPSHLVVAGWLLYGAIRAAAWLLQPKGMEIPAPLLILLLVLTTILGAAGFIWAVTLSFRGGYERRHGVAMAGAVLLIIYSLPAALAIYGLSRM